MMEKKIYILAATQISLQQPLSEAWMTDPVPTESDYTRCQDPNFREWLNPMESRRMGKIMKRALVTAMKVMKDTGISQPDAIITGTGLGCIENTQLFLEQLCEEGEEMLKPTHFMQSTHNTISSLIAIHGKCHGYNTTYSHQGVSFESALLDAFVQMRLGDIETALVTGNDELTPSFFSVLQRTGYIGQEGQVTASEGSVAMMLTTEAEGSLCEVEKVSMSYGKLIAENLSDTVDAVMLGTDGTEKNDVLYRQIADRLSGVPQLHYKHLFGEGYSASALGLYAAAHLLKKGEAPAMMRCDGHAEPLKLGRLLFVNHCNERNISYVLLKRMG